MHFSPAVDFSFLTMGPCPGCGHPREPRASAWNLNFTANFSANAKAWQWGLLRQPNGSTATVSAVNVRNPKFIPDLPGRYVLQVKVTNSTGAFAARTLTFPAVGPVMIRESASGGSGNLFSFVIEGEPDPSYAAQYGPAGPDGLALDSEGNVYVPLPNRTAVVHVTPSAQLIFPREAVWRGQPGRTTMTRR
jgi:hypothetical protein